MGVAVSGEGARASSGQGTWGPGDPILDSAPVSSWVPPLPIPHPLLLNFHAACTGDRRASHQNGSSAQSSPLLPAPRSAL